MAISLFTKPDLRGGELPVTGDLAVLPALVRNRVSSARMTANTDRILLFTRPNYAGDVMLKTGRQEIGRIGDPDRGGRNGFGNTVASVRLTPFTVRLAVHVVTADGGAFPGGRSTLLDVTRYLADVTAAANGLLAQAMIRLERAGTADLRVIPSSRYFDMKWELVPFLFQSYNVDDRVNVFYVNTLFKASGITAPRCIGNLIGNKIVIDDTAVTTAGNTLAHEVGHDLGLTHYWARNDPNNLMTGTSALGTFLAAAQIEEMQQRLGNDRRASRARQA